MSTVNNIKKLNKSKRKGDEGSPEDVDFFEKSSDVDGDAKKLKYTTTPHVLDEQGVPVTSFVLSTAFLATCDQSTLAVASDAGTPFNSPLNTPVPSSLEVVSIPQVAAVVKSNIYDIGNETMRNYCRVRLSQDKIFYFSDFKYENMLRITTREKRATEMWDNLKLDFNEETYKYASIQSPVGVLSFSTINYDGNRFETNEQLKPKTDGAVKQAIQWSARAYVEEGRDQFDQAHDKTGNEFVKWCEHLGSDWFIEQLKPLAGKHALESFVRDAKDSLNKFDRISKPNVDQVFEMIKRTKLKPLIKKDKNGLCAVNFGTGLFRAPNKRDEKETAQGSVYVPPTEYMSDVYKNSGEKLIFNDIPVYTKRSDAELAEGWPHCTLYKQIPRDQVCIRNGDLGAVVFSPGAINNAGPNMGMMGYLKAVIWYGPGTELSMMRPDVSNFDQCPELATMPPKMPGSESFFDMRARLQNK